MSYEKQTWNKYDDLKTEEENIENGAVVTDNRMNHIEEGIYSHTIDISNPHKVTAAQVGLGNIQNFGLATEDEAKQAISNAKYMTPSLTQAVLSANINSIAYANSADGTDGFTTVYPNLNLFNDTSSTLKTLSYKGWGTNSLATNIVNFEKGKTYTYSVWIQDCDIDLRAILYLYDSAGVGYNNIGNTIKAGTSGFSTITFTVAIDVASYKASIIFVANQSILHDLKYSKLKLEQGSTSTLYMPSASEVTINDYPKYVGFSNTVKTNKSASDYTWFPVKDSELTNKVESHINNKANPHAVTASQVGAYSKTEADVKFATGQSLIDLSTTVEGKADDSAVVHKTGDETIGGKKTFTEEIKQKNDVDWTYIPDSSNRAEYMRRGGTVTIRWDFTSTGNFDISLGSLPTDFAPRKRIFKSIPEASTTNSMHTLQINAFTGGSPGAITLFKATTGAVFSGQESFVVI